MITNKFLNNQSGFTLLETMVAIGILLVAVVGPISLIGNATHNLYYAKDEMVAINLAQEGVEVVRKLRDGNMLSGAAWDAGFNGTDYIVDPLSATPLNASIADQKVYVDPATGLYRQGSGFAGTTQFSRKVTIATTGLPAYERKVTSKVTWNTGNATGTVSVSENIFNWVP